MRTLIGIVTLGVSLALCGGASAQIAESEPTIVLVHGAFADSSSWNGVIAELDRTVVIEGASHAVMVSHADEVASLIEDAAKAGMPAPSPAQ